MAGACPRGDEELLMGKKGDGGTSAKLVTTVATAGGVFLIWAVATGVIVEAAKFFIVRGTMRKSVADAEVEAS
jgi:hypothetical protein